MIDMFKGMVNSPVAELAESISESATVIKVSNINAFPDPPNLAVIGTEEDAETIKYAAKTAEALSGCERGVQGTAKAWQAGDKIARNFTQKDHADLIDNMIEVHNLAEGLKTKLGLQYYFASQQDIPPDDFAAPENFVIDYKGRTIQDGEIFLISFGALGDATTSFTIENKPIVDWKGMNIPSDKHVRIENRVFLCTLRNDKYRLDIELAQKINQAFQSASEGKQAIAAALTGKGVSANSNETFSALAGKVGQIKNASGNAVPADVLAGKTFSTNNGTNLIGTAEIITPSQKKDIANAITSKGVATSTTASWGQIEQNIRNIKSLSAIPHFNLRHAQAVTIDFTATYSGYSHIGYTWEKEIVFETNSFVFLEQMWMDEITKTFSNKIGIITPVIATNYGNTFYVNADDRAHYMYFVSKGGAVKAKVQTKSAGFASGQFKYKVIKV